MDAPGQGGDTGLVSKSSIPLVPTVPRRKSWSWLGLGLLGASALLGYKRSSVASWVMPKLGALQLPLPGAAQTVGGVSVVLGLVGLGSAVVAELHSLGSAAFDALSEDVHEVAQDLEYRLRVGCRKESERLRASLSEVAAGARAAAMAYELSADPQLAFSLRVREEVVDIFNGFSAVVCRNPLLEKDMVVGTRVAMSDDCLKTKGRAGPLNPGDVGTIVQVFESSHVEVKLDDSGETRWYSEESLRRLDSEPAVTVNVADELMHEARSALREEDSGMVVGSRVAVFNSCLLPVETAEGRAARAGPGKVGTIVQLSSLKSRIFKVESEGPGTGLGKTGWYSEDDLRRPEPTVGDAVVVDNELDYGILKPGEVGVVVSDAKETSSPKRQQADDSDDGQPGDVIHHLRVEVPGGRQYTYERSLLKLAPKLPDARVITAQDVSVTSLTDKFGMARGFVYWIPPASLGERVKVLVLFTGTNHAGFWNKAKVWLGTNLRPFTKELSKECYGPGVAEKELKAHGGFVEYNKDIVPQLLGILENAKRATGTADMKPTVYLAGHSLGGALAVLNSVALYGHKAVNILECFTIACPRVLGLEGACFLAEQDRSQSDMIHVVHKDDWVPFIKLPWSPLVPHTFPAIVGRSTVLTDSTRAMGLTLSSSPFMALSESVLGHAHRSYCATVMSAPDFLTVWAARRLHAPEGFKDNLKWRSKFEK